MRMCDADSSQGHLLCGNITFSKLLSLLRGDHQLVGSWQRTIV